jgi:hypothetical protein
MLIGAATKYRSEVVGRGRPLLKPEKESPVRRVGRSRARERKKD